MKANRTRTRAFLRPAPLAGFAIFAFLPGLLLLAACIYGGAWVWVSLIWIGGGSQLLDALLARRFADPVADEAPGANLLSVCLALMHFILLPMGLAALTAPALGVAGKIALFLALGMFFGQISNSNAHELIHRGRRDLFRLGAAIYVSLLFGHHTSAHRLVHHRHVATPLDPNTARLGESFWRFFPRAWLGSFRAGFEAERARGDGRYRINPYLIWTGGALICCIAVFFWLGASGLLTYVALCLYAHMQLMLSDYVQHYGLLRAKLENGRYAPVGPAHSWDAPHFLSSLMMVNAPRHSDHHAHPGREYPVLRLQVQENPRPMLPYSLPLMAAIATVPPFWRRVMDKRVARMREIA